MTQQTLNTILAAIDADKHGSFASKYGVQGFPTIKVFGASKKNPTDYSGGRSRPRPDGIELVVHARLRPSTLTCRGRPARTAPGVGPTTLQIVLRRTPAGSRIAGMQRR